MAPLAALVVACTLLAPAAAAQPGAQAEFDFEAVTFRAASGEAPQVDLYTRVPYPSLRFLRRDDGFEARYSLAATVHRAGRNDRPEGLVASRAWNRRVAAPNYAVTQADSLADYGVFPLNLPPGRYVLSVRLEDGGSSGAFSRDRVIEVPALNAPLAMSDLLLADRYDAASQRLSPNVVNAIPSEQASFALFFEVYARQAEQVRVRYTVRGLTNERRRAGGLMGLFGRRDREASAALFEVEERLDVRPGRNAASRTFPTARFDIGEYELVVRLERQNGSLVAERTKPFAVRWTGLPEHIQDLDTAIAQLRYIAKERDIRAMQQAPTWEERFRLFREFWDRRDPSPGTQRNERMEEYYFRVAHANNAYGRQPGSGWASDRGEVYIRFGEPDFVENHGAAQNARPYQIWYYNRIGRRFIFVEDGASGDFRLMVPLWDERTRM
jgi:GWxTD domain-containing protein